MKQKQTTLPTRDAIVLHTTDSVATALRPLAVGERISVETPNGSIELMVQETIELCHKLAIIDHVKGDPIRKYGEIIGLASAPVRAGALVHIHNLRSLRAQSAVVQQDLKQP